MIYILLIMTIITKTLLKEHVWPFLFGIATIVFVFLLNIVFRDMGRLLGRGLPFKIVFEFFYLNLAWIIALAVPMSALLSSLMAFGRLSSDNEITALKASGVHFYRLIFPIIIAATVLMIIMVIFNNLVLPEFNHRWRILFSDISRTRPTLSLEPDVFFDDIPNYTILVHRVKEKSNQLEGIVINDTRDANFAKTIVARKGQFVFLKEEERMVMTLYSGEIHEIEKENLANYRRMKFEKQSFSIVVSDVVLKRSNTERRGDREKSASMMVQDIKKNAQVLSENEQNIRHMVLSDMKGVFPRRIVGDKESFSASMNLKVTDLLRMERMLQIIQGEKSVIRGYKKAIASLRVEIQKKFSIPVACLVFVLVGAPLGVLVRQSGLATAGWMSIIFYLIYWSFLIGGEQLADRMILNPLLAMWAPNVIVGVAGIVLVVQTATERSFLILVKRMGTWIKGFIK